MFHELTEINIDAPIHKALIKITKSLDGDSDILFLENSSSLYDAVSVANFRTWCVENKIRHNCLFSISELPFDYVCKCIRNAKIIVFQTTGTYPIVRQIQEFILSLEKGWEKKIIECYVHEPKIQMLPKGTRHSVWLLDSFHPIMEVWELAKLKKNKYYWDCKIVSVK